MASRGILVDCMCGWTGRKVFRTDVCECDTYCTHSHFGPCPNCGGRVTPTADRKADALNQAASEAYLAERSLSPGGRETTDE